MWFYLFLGLHLLSIGHLIHSVLQIGVCSSIDRDIRVRKILVVSLVFFLLLTLVMMVMFSYWFAVSLGLALVSPLILSLYFCVEESYMERKQRS